MTCNLLAILLIGWPALICTGWFLCAVLTVAWIHFFPENRDDQDADI